MAAKSLSEVNQPLCVLVPRWVTATVRVALLIDHSDIARSLTLGTGNQMGKVLVIGWKILAIGWAK